MAGKNRAPALIAALALVFLPVGTRAAGVDPYEAGIKQLSAKQFAQAGLSFQQAVKANPKNAMAFYYLALARHYQGDRSGAMNAYSRVISTFPGSQASSLALRGMASIDPSIMQKLGLASAGGNSGASAAPSGGGRNYGSNYTASSSSSSNDTVPDECRVYFTKDANCFVMDVRLGNRPLKMMFDTGAESTVVGKNHLQELGLPLPTGPSVGTAHGVGEGGGQRFWVQKMDVTLGGITRRNFEVCVQEHMPGYPLLGQTFFHDMRYTVDNGANSIHFMKKKSDRGSVYSSLSRDPNVVPFTREGNEIVVVTEVNGRKLPMYFDTGASGVAFSPEHLSQVGLTIPDDARTSMSQGIAGNSLVRNFPVRSLKLGPIEKRDFEIGVTMSSHMPHPLLGQTFYNDYQYTIDYDKSVIHFMRR